MADSVQVGDQVALYSQEHGGYMFSHFSSAAESQLYVYHNQDRDKAVGIQTQQAVAFEIHWKNRFKLRKKYERMKRQPEQHSDNKLHEAKVNAEEETRDNEKEQMRLRSKPLRYGQEIQLLHKFTNKFIHVSTGQTSTRVKNNLMVYLSEKNGKTAQYKIRPKYKVKSEGDLVRVGDQVVFESIKSPGHYLDLSPAFSTRKGQYRHEVNLGVNTQRFTIVRVQQCSVDPSLIKGGCVLRFYHKEIGAYLSAEGVFPSTVSNNVHMRVRKVDQTRPKTNYPSSSGIVYWQIEAEDSVLNGDVIKWQQQVRIRHMTTRLYLCVLSDGTVTLEENAYNPNTVFRMHPVIEESDEIVFESYCRLEHVLTGFWLQGHEDKKFVRSDHAEEGVEGHQIEALQWDGAPLCQVTAAPEQKDDDAFTLQMVEKEDLENFNMVAGFVPLILDLHGGVQKSENLYKQLHKLHQALLEMKDFMIVDEKPVKNRQKLMRNLRVIDLCVEFLKKPLPGIGGDRQVCQMYAAVQQVMYDVLENYLKGDSRKNELYFAKYIGFFKTQFSSSMSIRLKAVTMITELIRDNWKIVSNITNEDIDEFVGLVRQYKDYRYLDLLGVLCVCDGVAETENQTYITEKWLCSRQGGVFYTEIGTAIDKDDNNVYVSMKDTTGPWVPLHDFVKTITPHVSGIDAMRTPTAVPQLNPLGNIRTEIMYSGSPHMDLISYDISLLNEYLVHGPNNTEGADASENIKFLKRQLDLFGNLCHGRNSFAIDVITKSLKYLSWEEAYICLKNKNLPYDLRAEYCRLMINLFVDVEGQYPILEHINLSFDYDQLDSSSSFIQERIQAVFARTRDSDKFRLLRDWITDFLDNHKSMTASDIPLNLLIEQVLKLVYHLVRFGFYGDAHNIKQLVKPMEDLMDGRNDRKFSKTKKNRQSKREGKEEDIQETKYSKEERYWPGPETEAVVNAKYRAMEVLGLLLTFQLNRHLEQFVSWFKEIRDNECDWYGLYQLTQRDAKGSVSFITKKNALSKVEGMIEDTAYLDPDKVTPILMDLSKYQYDKMVNKAMMLLKKIFTCRTDIFKYTVDCQVLIMDSSKEVYSYVWQNMPHICKMSKCKLTEEKAAEIIEILKKFSSFCHLPNDPGERHPLNQKILMNSGILPPLCEVYKMIREERTKKASCVRLVVQQCLNLLRLLAMGNKVAQNYIFTHMDNLLRIKGLEPDMAVVLVEVFTGNEETCMKVSHKQIKRITMLAAEHKEKAPEFLDVLCAIVKVEELNLPLKKNQLTVVQCVMEQYSDIGYLLEQPQEERFQVLLGQRGPAHLSHLISLVDLFAICAEGESQYIESICQTLFSVDDLMKIITHPEVDANLKRPFLMYLLEVYITVGGSLTGNPDVQDLPHTSAPWHKDIIRETKELTQFVTTHREMVARYVKQQPPKSDLPDTKPDQINGMLHYYFEALMPFLKKFYKSLYIADQHTEVNSIVDELARAFVDLSVVLKPLLCSKTQMDTLQQCVTTLLTHSNQTQEVQQTFANRFNSVMFKDNIVSKAKVDYEEKHREENKLNDELNTYAVNLQKLYQGANTVEEQLDYNSSRKYWDEDSDVELPLGKEFQQHLKCFMDSSAPSPNDAYKPALTLVKQLSISATKLKACEWLDGEQEQLDVRCLQLLRALIHNQERKLPEDWKSDSRSLEKELKSIQDVQDFFNKHDAMSDILLLISRPQENIVKEVLAFLSIMLFNGSSSSQESLIRSFTGTREEMFFFVIRDYFVSAAAETKERRQLYAQYEAGQLEAQAEARTLRMAVFTPDQPVKVRKMTDMMQLETIKENPQSGDQDPDQDEEPSKDTKQMSSADGLSSPDVNSALDPVKNILPAQPNEKIALVLKVLALMCDGQYKPLQDYLRHQPDNIKTANLVAESTKFLQYFYTDINSGTVGLVIQLMSALVEFASGNPENQVVIFEENIIDYINHILRSCKVTKLPADKVLEIKTIIGDLLMCLMEQRTKKTKTVIHDMMHLIDRESLKRIVTEEYKEREEREDNDVGFKYFFLLEKISEWTEGAYGKEWSEEDQEIYRFYKNDSACIEILKDGDVHRAHFTVSDRNVLRDEIKEKVKWNIDRSSATGKLRDLVGWSKEIIEDVDHQKRVRAFKPLAFIVRCWPLWNNGAIFLSLVINIIMLATWKAPGALGVTDVLENTTLPPEIHSPVPVTEEWYKYVLYGMGGLHNILSFGICISFFLSNRFKIPELWVNTRSLYGKRKNTEHKNKGTLKINLIGILPIYYLCFLGFSVAGTFVYGYFFAFHLLNIIYSNQLLQRVMQAITKNGRSLLWVMVLGVIVIYIFSLVAFALLRGSFNPDGEQTFYCATLYECTVTILRFGIIGEMFEFMQPIEIERNFMNFEIHAIFHLAFFILITTIGLNIIFGIIVDTFSELRDVQWDAQNDMRKLCFICGRESYEFEKHGHGFQAHVKKEHNMWDYIYFFIHLREKDKMDYTDLELYAHKQFEQDGFDFFPLNRALVLDNLKDDEIKMRVDEILQYVHALSQKQEAEQLEKKKKKKEENR